MQKGDLVRYRGWNETPYAIIVDTKFENSDFHKRIKVMWLGSKVPIQAKVISVTGSRFSAWCSPKHFELVDEN